MICYRCDWCDLVKPAALEDVGVPIRPAGWVVRFKDGYPLLPNGIRPPWCVVHFCTDEHAAAWQTHANYNADQDAEAKKPPQGPADAQAAEIGQTV